MPTRLATSLITLDEGKMHQIDTRNVENLFSMWTVFNRCAESLDQGRRLENLSWRLWNRETFCCEPKAEFANPPARPNHTPRQSRLDMPQLSSSVDSASSEEYESTATSGRQTPLSPVTIRALSSSSTSFDCLTPGDRSKAKPISSQAWEKMVISIKETKINRKADMTALSSSVASAVRPQVTQTEATDVPTPVAEDTYKSLPRASHSSASTIPLSSPESSLAQSQTYGSETSAEFISTPDVVRGFTPASISCHRMSTPQTSAVQPEQAPVKSAMRAKADLPSKKPQFFVGGGSSDEDTSSFEDQIGAERRKSPQTAFKAPGNIKQASFSDKVETRRFVDGASDDEGAIESDEEDDDDVDESAIEEEDDDEDEWDEVSDDGESEQMPVPKFERIDSKANLVSRQSLITSALHQSDRENQLAHQAAVNNRLTTSATQLRRSSRQTSPSGPSLATSPDDSMQGLKIPRPKPIMTTTNTHPPALSPKTTRRNMLATELTESLRRHLLWERQQKNVAANAVLKRRHTSQDVANLKKQPEPQGSGAESKNNSWNDYYEHEYHSKGW